LAVGRGPLHTNLATAPSQLPLLLLPGVLKTPGAWVVGLALLMLASLWLWRANFRRLRAVADTPTSRIASAHQGYVELHGVAQSDSPEPMRAPLTRRACVWYRYAIERKGSKNKWVTEEKGASDTPFLLDDGSGKATVEVRKAEMIVQGARQWIQGKRRYTEWIIAPGEHVYAIGGFASEGGPNTTLNVDQDVSALLAEWKRRRMALLERFDLDGDRNLDEQEWMLARKAARREVEQRHREIRSEPVTHVLRRPEADQLFLISNLDPDQVARRHRLWQWLHLIAAAAAAVGLTALLLDR
jgi:hypothetical protein